MEVEKITVRVEYAGVTFGAVAVLTDREARTKEGAAGAAAALCAELERALKEGTLAGVLAGSGNGQGGHQDHAEPPLPAATTWERRKEPRDIPEHFCFEHEEEFTRQSNARGVWYSHRKGDGGWCKEVNP